MQHHMYLFSDKAKQNKQEVTTIGYAGQMQILSVPNIGLDSYVELQPRV